MDTAANNGPVRRIFAARGVSVREVADHFGVDEETMSAFLHQHEVEIADAMRDAAIQTVEELGFAELLFELSDIEKDE
jgi:phage antirepressor YoqD-like protein